MIWLCQAKQETATQPSAAFRLLAFINTNSNYRTARTMQRMASGIR